MSYMSTLHVISMDWKQCNYLSTGNLIKYTVRHWYNGIRHSCLNQRTCLDIAIYMSTYTYPLMNKTGHNHVCTLQCHWYQKCVLVTQSCMTLWDSMDWSLSGSSVHGNIGVGCHTLKEDSESWLNCLLGENTHWKLTRNY